MSKKTFLSICSALVIFAIAVMVVLLSAQTDAQTDLRVEVVFWHFWGGRDRPVVEQIVQKFNDSQTRYVVRPIALPGSNLDLKFFLSVAGGDPPDLLNHDDPIVADWAHRGVLTPLDELADDDQIGRIHDWLFPAARQLGTYDGRLYALCNGLDIRALYCNKTLLDEHGLSLPQSTDDLDHIAETISPPGATGPRKRMGYLPDPRRIWAWGIAFGGQFADPQASTPAKRITADSPKIVAALRWMASYRDRYGANQVAAFRSGEQAITGAAFPLLADRRYAVVMDGQWRVRDLADAEAAARRKGSQPDEFAVVPLPAPTGGRKGAGWVNGNFFVIPRHARHKRGAWEFAKFWIGFEGREAMAADACARGGWIPPSPVVTRQPAYQNALRRWPLLEEFVRLAGSPNQVPVPSLPVGSLYYQQVVQAAQQAMYRGEDPKRALHRAAENVRARLREATQHD